MSDTNASRVAAAWEAGLVPINLPPEIQLGEFKPCVTYNEELRFTQMILEDAPTVWSAWLVTIIGHSVDLGYHAETGKLVAIKIWDDVRMRPIR